MVRPIQESSKDEVTFRLGDEVWVKPPDARCTSHWKKGVVTGINSNNNVSVDGMPRHVLDIRHVVQLAEDAILCPREGDVVPPELVEGGIVPAERLEGHVVLYELPEEQSSENEEPDEVAGGIVPAGLLEGQVVLHDLPEEPSSGGEEPDGVDDRRYPLRDRGPPLWMNDYVNVDL